MALKSLIMLGGIVISQAVVSYAAGAAEAIRMSGAEGAAESTQPAANTGWVAAEQLRLSVLRARFAAQQQSMDAEQRELAKLTNGGLLSPTDLAARNNAFRTKAARLQAAAMVLNADMAMVQRAQSRSASRPASETEVTGNNVTWVLTDKGAYFANIDRTWTYFDSDRPMVEAVYRELSRAAGFVIMLDERTGLRRSIDFGAGNIRIQQTAANEQFIPIMGAGAEVHGQNVMRVTYPGGELRQVRPGAWIERQRSRTIAKFVELKRTRDFVQLADDSRKMYLIVSIDPGQILVSYYDRPGQTQNLYPIRAMTARFIPDGPVID